MRRGLPTSLAGTVAALALLVAGCGKSESGPDAVPTTVTPSSAVVAEAVPVTTAPAVSTTTTTTPITTTSTSVPVPLPDIDEELGEFDDLESLLDELDDLLSDL